MLKKIIYSNGVAEGIYSIFSRLSHMGGIRLTSKGYGRIKRDCVGSNNNVSIDENTIVHKLELIIRGNENRISVGKNCIIGPGCPFRIEGNNITIEVGDGTTF